jgi:hypothetical protein
MLQTYKNVVHVLLLIQLYLIYHNTYVDPSDLRWLYVFFYGYLVLKLRNLEVNPEIMEQIIKEYKDKHNKKDKDDI